MSTSKKLILFSTLLFVVIFLSAAGFSLIEGWPFGDSLYMTVITVATVGYREVAELSQVGKYYTILVILVGVGVVGFTLSNFTAFIVSGQIQKLEEMAG